MKTYFDEICRAMNEIAQLENSLFIGQAVEYPGTGMFESLKFIARERRMELPVEEDFQLGLSIGLALTGILPISIFPRWNFLLLASNQLLNHLDKLGELFKTERPPKVIIRTAIGSVNPLNPGPQHLGDFTSGFRQLAQKINIVRLDGKEMIFDEYMRAVEREDGVSTILVEWSDKYNE